MFSRNNLNDVSNKDVLFNDQSVLSEMKEFQSFIQIAACSRSTFIIAFFFLQLLSQAFM